MALAMVVDAEIEKMAKAAVASVGNVRSMRMEEGEGTHADGTAGTGC